MIPPSLKVLFEKYQNALKEIIRYHDLGPACFTSNMPYFINYILILRCNNQSVVANYVFMLT